MFVVFIVGKLFRAFWRHKERDSKQLKAAPVHVSGACLDHHHVFGGCSSGTHHTHHLKTFRAGYSGEPKMLPPASFYRTCCFTFFSIVFLLHNFFFSTFLPSVLAQTFQAFSTR